MTSNIMSENTGNITITTIRNAGLFGDDLFFAHSDGVLVGSLSVHRGSGVTDEEATSQLLKRVKMAAEWHNHMNNQHNAAIEYAAAQVAKYTATAEQQREAELEAEAKFKIETSALYAKTSAMYAKTVSETKFSRSVQDIRNSKTTSDPSFYFSLSEGEADDLEEMMKLRGIKGSLADGVYEILLGEIS